MPGDTFGFLPVSWEVAVNRPHFPKIPFGRLIFRQAHYRRKFISGGISFQTEFISDDRFRHDCFRKDYPNERSDRRGRKPRRRAKPMEICFQITRVWLSGQAPACKAVYTGSNPVTRSKVWPNKSGLHGSISAVSRATDRTRFLPRTGEHGRAPIERLGGGSQGVTRRLAICRVPRERGIRTPRSPTIELTRIILLRSKFADHETVTDCYLDCVSTHPAVNQLSVQLADNRPA